MTNTLLDGKILASDSERNLISRVDKLNDLGIIPCLATILVGNDPASATYVKMKQNTCKRLGIKSLAVELSSKTTTEELIKKISELNADELVHGILLQHPVPKQIDERKCFNHIDVAKDVDGVTTLGFGNMTMGVNAYGSCTPQGIIRILEHYNIELSGLNAVIVGRSPILGKPMSMMLLNKNATVTICHSRTKSLSEIVKNADLVVAAVGIPKFIKKNWLKDGVILIDAGYHPIENCGDVDLTDIEKVAHAYTPVPGGVGPMTINTLMLQTIQAAEKNCNVQ